MPEVFLKLQLELFPERSFSKRKHSLTKSTCSDYPERENKKVNKICSCCVLFTSLCCKKKRNKQTKITKFRVSSQTIIWQEKHDTVFWNWYLLWVKQFQLRRQNRMLVPARGSFQNFWKHSVLFIWGPPRLALEFRDISSLNNCFIIILTHQKQNFTQEIQQLGKISLMVLDGCRSRVGLMTLMHGDEERYLQPRRSESQEEVRVHSYLKCTGRIVCQCLLPTKVRTWNHRTAVFVIRIFVIRWKEIDDDPHGGPGLWRVFLNGD